MEEKYGVWSKELVIVVILFCVISIGFYLFDNRQCLKQITISGFQIGAMRVQCKEGL